jgi:hypothetical protein
VIRGLGAGAHPRQGRTRVSRVVRRRIISIPDSAGASACDGNIAQAISNVVPGMANVRVPSECSRRVVGPGLWLPWAPLMRAVIRVGISLGGSRSKPEGGKCASARQQGRRDDPLGFRCRLQVVIPPFVLTPRKMALAVLCTSLLELTGSFPMSASYCPRIPICTLGRKFESAFRPERASDLKLPCPHILADLENRSLILWLNPFPQAALAQLLS